MHLILWPIHVVFWLLLLPFHLVFGIVGLALGLFILLLYAAVGAMLAGTMGLPVLLGAALGGLLQLWGLILIVAVGFVRRLARAT